MSHWYHLHTIWGITHAQQAYIISFVAYQDVHQESTLTSFGSLHSLPSLGVESHITHAAFSYSQCKNQKGNKIHQSSTWLIKSLSHCSSFPVALQLKLLAFYLQGSLILQLSIWMAMGKSYHNLFNPWSLFLLPAKNLCSLLWSLLPLLKQQKTFYKVTYTPSVRCSLTYNENHGIA